MSYNTVDECEKVIQEQARYIDQLETEIELIRSSMFWRLYKPARFMLLLPKRIVAKIVREKKYRYEIDLISKSGLLDSEFYFDQYPHVKNSNISAIEHYVKYGAIEGGKPNKDFVLHGLEDCGHRDFKNPLVEYIESYARMEVDVSVDLPKMEQKVLKKDIREGSVLFFSITTKKNLHHAIASQKSVIKDDPSARFVIYIVDKVLSKNDLCLVNKLLNDGIEIVCFDTIRNNIVLDSFNELLSTYSDTDIVDAVLPYIIEYLMNNEYENIVYIKHSVMLKERLNVCELVGKTIDSSILKCEMKCNIDMLIVPNTLMASEFINSWRSCLLKDGLAVIGDIIYASIPNIVNSVAYELNSSGSDVVSFDHPEYFYLDNTVSGSFESKCSFGMNLIGYFDNVIGISQVPKNLCKVALLSMIPISVTTRRSYTHSLSTNEERYFFSRFESKDSNYCCNIIFLNPPEMSQYFTQNEKVCLGKKNIGVWWWEFDDYFPYTDGYDYVDELIVFSDFVATALRKAAKKDIKIHKLQYPFIRDWGELASVEAVRELYGISRDSFVYVYSFDFNSNCERKNPVSLIYAFRNVVQNCSNDYSLQLVIKCNNSNNEKYQLLVDLIAEQGLEAHVTIICKSLSRNELISLFNACDVYVSLHRAEGLGLGMLEAMSLGKPVVATAFGGNLDFMNNDNSCLVDYVYTDVKEDFGAYKRGWRWAEPDIDNASHYMELLYRNRSVYEEISENAFKYVRDNYDEKKFVKSLYGILD